jgi:hypothetical protein
VDAVLVPAASLDAIPQINGTASAAAATAATAAPAPAPAKTGGRSQDFCSASNAQSLACLLHSSVQTLLVDTANTPLGCVRHVMAFLGGACRASSSCKSAQDLAQVAKLREWASVVGAV